MQAVGEDPMRTLLLACFSTVMAVSTCAACFAQPSEHERLALTIAPYVDAQTLVVAHFNLAAIDAQKTLTLLASLFRLPEQEHARLQVQFAPLGVLHGALPEGGSADVFVVVSIADIQLAQAGIGAKKPAPNGGHPGDDSKKASLPFFVVVSLERNSPASPIATEIRRALAAQHRADVAMERVGNAIVTGSPRTIERLKKSQGTNRPEISAALEAAGEGAAHLLFVPSAEARFAAEALLPKLPPGLGGGATKTWTRGVVWTAVGLDLPPAEPAARIVVQSASNETALALARQLAEITKSLGQQPEIQSAFPKLDDIAKRLEPTVSDDRLVIDVNEGTATLEDLTSYLAAVLAGSRSGTPPPGD
jgi:hypothetical protein